MREYKTSLGTIVVSKLKDVPIESIKLDEESWTWYELPKTPDSYYVKIVPKEPALLKGSKQA